MTTQFLKTHYWRGASILTPEQIEEIRCLKNKVPVYKIVRNFYINKNRVFDIWNNSERLQQSFFLASSKKENLVNELILPSSDLSREGRNEYPKAGRGFLDIDHEELNRLYEEVVKRSKKNIASSKRILGSK